MKDPAFLFYPGDWLGGTMGMSLEQKGGYIELLMMQFNLGQFTEAHAKQVLGTCFDVVWPTIKQKFKTDGNYFYNERLRLEIMRRREFCKSRHLNGLVEKKKKHKLKHEDKLMENENKNENENEVDDVNVGGGRGGGSNPPAKVTRNRYEFLDNLIDEFKDAYRIKGLEYMVVNTGKERMAAGKLLNIFSASFPAASTADTVAGMRAFFDLCMTINDPWLSQNMSLPIIVSKINTINNILQNGDKRSNSKGGVTDRELTKIFSSNWGNK